MKALQERGKGDVWFYGRAIHPSFLVIFFVGPFSGSHGNEGALGELPLRLHEMLEVCSSGFSGRIGTNTTCVHSCLGIVWGLRHFVLASEQTASKLTASSVGMLFLSLGYSIFNLILLTQAESMLPSGWYFGSRGRGTNAVVVGTMYW